jgi:hypothetical protein
VVEVIGIITIPVKVLILVVVVAVGVAQEEKEEAFPITEVEVVFVVSFPKKKIEQISEYKILFQVEVVAVVVGILSVIVVIVVSFN